VAFSSERTYSDGAVFFKVTPVGFESSPMIAFSVAPSGSIRIAVTAESALNSEVEFAPLVAAAPFAAASFDGAAEALPATRHKTAATANKPLRIERFPRMTLGLTIMSFSIYSNVKQPVPKAEPTQRCLGYDAFDRQRDCNENGNNHLLNR
jgi:hypothetical protein